VEERAVHLFEAEERVEGVVRRAALEAAATRFDGGVCLLRRWSHLARGHVSSPRSGGERTA
jgi:hypothetical protein